jgi:hypothetical protein
MAILSAAALVRGTERARVTRAIHPGSRGLEAMEATGDGRSKGSGDSSRSIEKNGEVSFRFLWDGFGGLNCSNKPGI